MIPVLDDRTRESLMARLAARVRQYAPMWRYEPSGTGSEGDPGAAIAELFGELFYQTIDRYNQVPQKLYIEFLSMLGVAAPTVLPASGYMQFGLSGPGEPVAVPSGTEVYASMPDGDDIVFTTERKIEATAAQLAGAYYVDTQAGYIEELDLTRETPFFAPAGGKNLQFHRFAISQNEVLALAGPCKIDVTLRQTTRFLEESTARRLSDPAFATWRYWNGERYVAFDSVAAESGTVVLGKNNPDRLMPDEDGRICVYCDMEHGGDGEIILNGVTLASSMPDGAAADSLSNNDVPIPQGEGGYCFSRRPGPYELFYVRSDDIFVKRGAYINVRFDMSMVVSSDVDTGPQYEFNKRIIDKQDAVRVMPDDVYVEQVVWEYFNGSGWANLPVTGNVNPFSGKSGGGLMVFFTVPRDIAPVLVNAQEGYYIRARVVSVDNYLSMRPKWILPFIRQAECAYQYTDDVPADYICAYGNAHKREIEDAAGINNLAMTVYAPMEPHPRAVYLRFDSSPHAMPLSVMFNMAGEKVLDSKIVFEAYGEGRFSRIRAIDRTQNLRYSDLAFLYVPEPLDEAEFFGVPGYWLRMSLSSFIFTQERAPCVSGIQLNVVLAQQLQQADEQVFDSGPYDAGRTLELLEKPVLACEVWVDELSALSAADMESLEREFFGRVRIEREAGEVTRCWVKWERVASLELALPNQRVYELDPFAGTIQFGKGVSGMVPPRGELNIRVRYTYGGGAAGNLPPGRVNAFVGAVPRVSDVTNITSMSGGEDRPPMPRLERLGNKRLRHRNVAFSVSDFEEIVLEQFPRAAQAKCFSNIDETGAGAPGHVCLVIMGREPGGERMTYELCREAYAYLTKRCDCNLLSEGRLHVVPSVEMTVNVEARVVLADLDLAAVTQQKIADALAGLIDNVWRGREIGGQIALNEIYQTIKSTDNVQSITRILPEGSFRREGRQYLVALDDERHYPFVTVRSGLHTIRIG